MKDKGKKSNLVFYGWWIVVGGFTMAMYISGFIHFSITALLEPINKEFNWGYAQVSLAASIRGLESSILAPFIGILVDRIGPRKLAITGAFCIGAGMLLLSQVDSLALFYLSFIIIAIGSATCIGVVPITTISHWFRKNVTLATGILVSGTAMGGLLIPVATGLIDSVTWRGAVAIIGIGGLIVLIPLSLLFRHKPEHYGHRPDGIAAADLPRKDIQQAPEKEMTIRQVLRTRAFWQITVGFVCHMTAMNAILCHIMPFLGTTGIARTTASFMAAAIPVISVTGRLGFGWLGDKFERRILASIGMMFVLVTMIMLSIAGPELHWVIFPALILAGIGYGGPVPLMPAMLREHFGRARLGTLLGIALGAANLGAIISPPVTGLVYDNTHSYTPAWIAMAIVVLVGTLSFLTVPKAGK
jgi:MFS transporter, OFA family, oxalate/formate antiporter